jgi:flagellar protein FliO/FliZ
LIWATSKMILGLGVVFILFFFLMRFLKRANAAGAGLSSDSEIRLLTTKPIAPQKFISLVEIGGEVLALGVSEAQITFLTKIENKEFIEKVTARHSITSDPSSFLQQLSRVPRSLKGGHLRISHGK